MAGPYDRRRSQREAQRERALMGESLAAFHARETAPPPTLAEVFAKNHVNRERCPYTPDMLEQPRRRKRRKA